MSNNQYRMSIADNIWASDIGRWTLDIQRTCNKVEMLVFEERLGKAQNQ